MQLHTRIIAETGKNMNSETQSAGVSQWRDIFGRRPTGPLAGLVVADLGRVLAGPYCTMLLADMGATVVKVEGPEGDETRNWKPPVRGDDGTYYLSLNRNKHSIRLDFRNADDRAVVQELIHRADVLVENFKPGDLDRFGLDYESVAADNPGLVYASVTGFGRHGGDDLPGYDLLVQGMSGLMSITGSPDTEGYRSGIAVFDVMTGLHLCVGILAALQDRERTGQGQRVEANLMSSALSAMVNQTGAYALAGVVPTRIGNEHPSIYPYEPFPTADGELIVAVGNDSQFRRLCNEIGVPELAEDPRFAEASARSVNRVELRPILRKAMRMSTSTDWFARLRGCRVPVAPIQDVAGGVRSARELGLDPVVTIGSGPDAMPTVRHPLEFSHTPASHDVPPPALDSGSEAIREWLSVPATVSRPRREQTRTTKEYD
jgi:crotonobetainyl-CoA:carnitine CoA-transferase CaiB-like acyl-CoA transferase